RNQLGSLPSCLCGLPLRVLNASNNKLVSLPETIGQLHSLMELVRPILSQFGTV
ncbi:Leucine-rich repeat and calponin y domain-containing protein 1, partial [Xenoophorus captivus]